MPAEVRTTFDVGRNLMKEVASRLGDAVPKPVEGSSLHVATLAAMARASVSRLSVTAALMAPKSVGEAAVLARSLIEGQASSRYIACGGDEAARDERARRFLDYKSVQLNKQAQSTNALLSRVGAMPRDPSLLNAYLADSEKARDAAVARFANIEKQFKRGWSGDGFGGMVRDILAKDPNDATEMLLDDYVLFSAFVHSTALDVSLSLSSESHSERERLASAVTCASVISVAGSCEAASRFSTWTMPRMDDLLTLARSEWGLK